MPNIIEIKTGNTLFGVSETEAIALINSKRYIMEGELVDISADVAIEIIEQERKKIIEEREELERQKTDLYIKRENLKIERKQFEQEKKNQINKHG